jgi:protein-disulfide isomerase
MRRTPVFIVLALSLVVTLSGCTRDIGGSAVGDADPPLAEITEDQFGIRAGLQNAPVQLELFTEPQCTHCAELQRNFGDEFAYYIGAGQLAITYRPLTFLDTPATDGHSARVANALFTAATAGGAPQQPVATTGRQFQLFVERLWANQRPGGTGPTDAELADLARRAGVPDDRIRDLERGVDVKREGDLADMESTNFEYLYEVDPVNTGTPTVVDLKAGQKVDIYDDDWLAKLMAS